MPDRGSHTPHLIPLFDNEFALDLAKEQGIQRPILSHLIHEVEVARKRIPQARGKTETQQRREGEHMLRTYVDTSRFRMISRITSQKNVG